MANIQEQLRLRREALAAAQAAGAVSGHTIASPTAGAGLDKATPQTNVATGMQSSTEHVNGVVVMSTLTPTKKIDNAKAEKALGIFEDIRLRKFTGKNGVWIKSEAGYFYAKDEKELANLRHHAKHGLVIELGLEQTQSKEAE